MSSARLLQLLGLLQSRREWSGAELASRLGVTTRTVRRDIDKLRALDYPVDASMGTSGGGYRLGAGASLPPLLLDDAEAVAVALSLRTASGTGVSGLGETALRALLKVEQVLPSRLRRRVSALAVASVPHVGSGPSVSHSTLTALGEACRDLRRVRFTYLSFSGETSAREVEPCQLVAWGRRWYLVAWDVARDGWRTFRADRISSLSGGGVRFAARSVPGGDAAAFVASRVAGRWPVQVVVRVGVPDTSSALDGWRSYGRVEAESTTSSLLHLGGETLQDVVFMLGSLTMDFTVVSPPELKDALRVAAERFLGASTR